jgi:putative serine protease PepD
VSDEHPGTEDTAPLSTSQGESWMPPREQPPPHQWAPPGPSGGSWGSAAYGQGAEYDAYDVADSYGPSYGSTYPPPGSTTPLPTRPERASRGRLPGWLWPVVCAVALVLGVVGGVLGGAAYNDWQRSQDEGQVSTGLSGAGTVSTAPLPRNHSVAAVARQLLPSTIQVLAEYGGNKDGATGSGFVLDRAGHYITNNHVVASAVADHGPIEIVDQHGNKYPATVVGRSPTYDLAVLYVKNGPHLPPASLGSASALQVGDEVVAFGSPLGLSSTVTAGIVSALNRPVTTGDSGSDSSFINAVQTDAAINPGNSGGPLVDLAGQVVGVNSAIATTGSSGTGQAGNIGVGFAIPIDQVKVTADQILRTGKARYPVIGASVNTGATSGSGARILGVTAGSPAAAGGLRTGDVVTSVGGEKVADGIALIVAIRSHQPGQTVPFTVRRGTQLLTLRITLGSQVG